MFIFAAFTRTVETLYEMRCCIPDCVSLALTPSGHYNYLPASGAKTKSEAVIDEVSEHIKQLLEDEILSGVIDDRGKFIYVTRSLIKNSVGICV